MILKRLSIYQYMETKLFDPSIVFALPTFHRNKKKSCSSPIERESLPSIPFLVHPCAFLEHLPIYADRILDSVTPFLLQVSMLVPYTCSAEELAAAMQESPGRMGSLLLLLSMPAARVSSCADASMVTLSVASGASVMVEIGSSMAEAVSSMVASC